MRFSDIPSLTLLGSSGKGFWSTLLAECILNGLVGKSGDALGTVGAALIGPKVLDPCSGDINSFAVQVEASSIGLDMTGRDGGLTGVSSGFSAVIKAFILFCTELFVLLTAGLVAGLVFAAAGTTGRGGAARNVDFKTP